MCVEKPADKGKPCPGPEELQAMAVTRTAIQAGFQTPEWCAAAFEPLGPSAAAPTFASVRVQECAIRLSSVLTPHCSARFGTEASLRGLHDLKAMWQAGPSTGNRLLDDEYASELLVAKTTPEQEAYSFFVRNFFVIRSFSQFVSLDYNS